MKIRMLRTDLQVNEQVFAIGTRRSGERLIVPVTIIDICPTFCDTPPNGLDCITMSKNGTKVVCRLRDLFKAQEDAEAALKQLEEQS